MQKILKILEELREIFLQISQKSLTNVQFGYADVENLVSLVRIYLIKNEWNAFVKKVGSIE